VDGIPLSLMMGNLENMLRGERGVLGICLGCGTKVMHKPPPDTTQFSNNNWSLHDYCTALMDDTL
jgi:hypothetical protein